MRKYLPTSLPKSTEELITLYERYVSPVTLLAGFTIDALIVQAVDLRTSVLLLLTYLSLAAASMVLLNLIIARRLLGKGWTFLVPILPAVIQFSFGGLFSGFVILFGQSASIGLTWVFVVILAALLISNERFRKFYRQFVFQIGILFFGLFSFFIFALPVILQRLGTDIFILGGILAVFILALFIRFIEYFLPALVREKRRRVIRSVAIIFIVLNIFYFSNIIPPLPLSLKGSAVSHSVMRSADAYILKVEPTTWYERYLRFKNVVHKAPGEKIYVFTAIFLPSGLSTTVKHQWLRYDEQAREWREAGEVQFLARGGRDGGYRGYTYRENLAEGKWRVNVRTETGRIIGRVSFTVKAADSAVPLEDETH